MFRAVAENLLAINIVWCGVLCLAFAAARDWAKATYFLGATLIQTSVWRM